MALNNNFESTQPYFEFILQKKFQIKFSLNLPCKNVHEIINLIFFFFLICKKFL